MNPTPEDLYNKKDGSDVYKNCVIDYQKQDHSAKNFLAVLRGDKEAIGNAGTRRVLSTIGSDSKIFISFIGDAAPGIFNFPNSTLQADVLQDTLNLMKQEDKFDKMVIYIDAPHSSTLVQNLKSDSGIYAVASSKQGEGAWATYCSPDNTVNGVVYNTCLGSAFTNSWTDDIDATNTANETLDDQFTKIDGAVLTTAQQFGDLSFKNDKVADFMGNANASQELLVNA